MNLDLFVYIGSKVHKQKFVVRCFKQTFFTGLQRSRDYIYLPKIRNNFLHLQDLFDEMRETFLQSPKCTSEFETQVSLNDEVQANMT